ncbi:MAG TPA: hypothetical protein VNW71_11645 [Thermoanaerobaculia bacterium]|nr:hypothetical protein [Thermoanaerobaculia bacterium]
MRKPVLFALVAALFGCQYNPFAHEYTSVRPDESAMIGEYALDSRSREMLQNVYKVAVPPTAFVLSPDHTFTLTDIPSCWRIDPSCSGKTENASGRWEIRRDHQDWWEVQLSCDRIDGEATSYGIGVNVRGDEPPYILHFTVGDPDAGEALAFEKKR